MPPAPPTGSSPVFKCMQSVEVNRTGVADTAETALWPLWRPPGCRRTSRGTLIRHPCGVLSGAIPRLAASMELASTGGSLVPPVGLSVGSEPGMLRAVLAAVALSAVTAPADRNSFATVVASEHPLALYARHTP